MPEPLEGITVLDFSRAEQGPLACVHLRDLGARVIKVEPPNGDPVRGTRSQGVSTAFIAHNRGKESITVNLKTEAGQELLRRLICLADVLVHNYTLDVAENLKLRYEDLATINPNLVYIWASGFGPTGPMRDHPAYDVIGQAYGGIASVTGDEGQQPIPAGAAISDATGAMNVLQAALIGLLRRERQGKGGEIVTSLYGGQLAIQSWELLTAGLSGGRPPRAGRGHPLLPIWGIFPTGDGYIALGGLGDQRWPVFCSLIGKAELATDPRFALGNSRMEHKEELIDAVIEALQARPASEWLAAFDANDIITAPVQSYDQILSDPQAWESGYLQKVEHPGLGQVTVVAAPFAIDGAPVRVKGTSPELGQNTEEIMLELDYNWDEITRIRESGAL